MFIILKRHEVLFHQLQDYRSDLLGLVENITEEQADRTPHGFRNNIRWNLGHVYLDQYLWLQHITKEKLDFPSHYPSFFGYGTSPQDWTSQPPSLEELRNLLHEQPKKIQQQFEDRLEETFPTTQSGMHTIAQVLVRTIFHEGLHQHIKRFL